MCVCGSHTWGAGLNHMDMDNTVLSWEGPIIEDMQATTRSLYSLVGPLTRT